jgi:hypothetical protein
MVDVQYSHSVFENPVENLVRVPHERHHAHPGASGDGRRGFGMIGDISDDVADASRDGCRYCVTIGATVGSNLAKIGDSTLRIPPSCGAKRAKGRLDFFLSRHAAAIGFIERLQFLCRRVIRLKAG